MRRGLTITGLASKIRVDSRSVSAYEHNEFAPSDSMVQILSECLDFPKEFFFGDDIDTPFVGDVSFRSLSKMSAGRRDAALSASVIGFMLNDWVQKKFETPKLNLPDLRDKTPEAAAEELRYHWGLGQHPVRNMVRLLEANGVKVFSLAEDTADIDAYSLWRDDSPYVFLNTLKSAEHSRFDAAHELGHLVLHRHGCPGGQLAEREADTFASAFLMPRDSVLATAPRIANLPALIEYKKKWLVSLSAIVYRLHKINMTSDWHNRMLCIEISKKGYRKSEPNSIQRETSILWNKVLSELRSENVTLNSIAKDLFVSKDEIKKLVFGLVLLDVGNIDFNSIAINSHSKNERANKVKLLLVKD